MISNFDKSLTMTISYTAADVASYIESTLKIFYWSGSAWSELSNCVVDTAAKTVTCDTDHFSTFGLFGQAAAASSSSNTTAAVSGTAFIAPSVPIILSYPKLAGACISYAASNTIQYAVSASSTFAGSSWLADNNRSICNLSSTSPIYLKFRSPDGGES